MNIHDWVNLAVGALANTLLAVIGYFLRKLYMIVLNFIEEHEYMYGQMGTHAEVINLHTDIIIKGGLAPIESIPRLDRRRREPRIIS